MSQLFLKEFDTHCRYYFSELLGRPLVKPTWVYISLSHACNFDCQMCGVKKILKNHSLDFPLIERVLAEIADWHSDSTILLTGGEPFLRSDIFDIINSSVSRGIQTEVVTNGSLISNASMARKIIDAGLKNIAISVDGASFKTHDEIRGVAGAYKKAAEALGYLIQEKKAKGSGPQISVWTTIMKENLQELSDIALWANNLGVECLVYHPVIVAQEDMQNTIKAGSFWITEDKIEILKSQIDKIAVLKKKNNMIAFLHHPGLWCDYFLGTLTKSSWKCNPFVFIDIGPDGNVRSCGPPFGNIKKMSLTACLETPEAQKARDRMLRCQKPCLQTCWAKPEADSLRQITERFISQVKTQTFDLSEKRNILKKGLVALSFYENLMKQDKGHEF